MTKQKYQQQNNAGQITPPILPLVAFIIDSLSRGGAERVAVNLANAIDPKRYRVLMVTTRCPGEFTSDLASHIEQVHLNRTGRFDLSAVRRLVAIFDERKVDLVHSHNHSSSYFCRIVRLFSKSHWKHVVHDHHGPAANSRTMDRLDRFFLKRVNFYIAVSEVLQRRAIDSIGVPAKRTAYIANGIGIPNITSSSPGYPFTIVQSARVVPVKNLELAIESAHHLSKAGVGFRWVVAGRLDDSDLQTRLQKKIVEYRLSESFTFLGEQSDISGLLGNAHVGVLTSQFEGLSMALLEYMAHGMPVVLTEVGQSSDLIRDAGGGSVVSQNDPAAFALALASLAVNDKKRELWGKYNREYVTSHYSSQTMAEKIMEIYDYQLNKCRECPKGVKFWK